jgi:hypothetical protein
VGALKGKDCTTCQRWKDTRSGGSAQSSWLQDVSLQCLPISSMSASSPRPSVAILTSKEEPNEAEADKSNRMTLCAPPRQRPRRPRKRARCRFSTEIRPTQLAEIRRYPKPSVPQLARLSRLAARPARHGRNQGLVSHSPCCPIFRPAATHRQQSTSSSLSRSCRMPHGRTIGQRGISPRR